MGCSYYNYVEGNQPGEVSPSDLIVSSRSRWSSNSQRFRIVQGPRVGPKWKGSSVSYAHVTISDAPSMVYLPTKLGDFQGKCWDSYSSTMEHMGQLRTGYIQVHGTKTSAPGFFAAGDVADHVYRQVESWRGGKKQQTRAVTRCESLQNELRSCWSENGASPKQSYFLGEDVIMTKHELWGQPNFRPK